MVRVGFSWHLAAASLQLPTGVGRVVATARWAQSRGCSAGRVAVCTPLRCLLSSNTCQLVELDACLMSFSYLEKVEKIDDGLLGDFCTEAPYSIGVLGRALICLQVFKAFFFSLIQRNLCAKDNIKEASKTQEHSRSISHRCWVTYRKVVLIAWGVLSPVGMFH